jgi:hypothetical protein
MIEEAEQSNARERWWQRSLERLAIPTSVPSDASAGGRAELQAAHAQIESLLVARDEDVMARWMDVRYDLPLEWQASQWIGKFRIWSTVKRARDTYDTGTWFGDPTLEASNPGKCDNASLDITPGRRGRTGALVPQSEWDRALTAAAAPRRRPRVPASTP